VRKIVYMISVSLDGFMAGPHGELDWQLVDEELHWHFNEVLRGSSVSLNGRVVYELMAAFWPTADADPSSSPPMVEYAGMWRDVPKIVYSRTLQQADWNATVEREVVAVDVAAMKSLLGGDMMVGGADLAASFERLGLIDEYRIYVHPALIGRGRPAFHPSESPVRLRLAETRTFTSGVVLLRYERAAVL
jgi:dihydrofolate reductase